MKLEYATASDFISFLNNSATVTNLGKILGLWDVRVYSQVIITYNV